ncbi:MAG: DUF4145 domain-containing protein [Planctomycetes bacterium]|nr:DUF4145 domain-containing protein [Planctomycetota bacterium]MBI3843402.1 DUF4145 domain-containing protein [Planctomycetota bacterium]
MARSIVSIFCPHCRRHTSLEPATAEVDHGFDTLRVSAIWKQGHDSIWWIGVCNSCRVPVLVHNGGDVVYPTAVPPPSEASIPDEIRGDLDEAKQCFAVSAWRGAAVMARRSMQSAALDKGMKPGNLGDQMAALHSGGRITVELKEWADVVRWVGNDAAHPGGDAVTREDAEDILRLAEQFLHVLYVAPSIAKALRAKKKK